MIISPCISICKTDPVTGYCYGCGRNDDEKKIWKDQETSDYSPNQQFLCYIIYSNTVCKLEEILRKLEENTKKQKNK